MTASYPEAIKAFTRLLDGTDIYRALHHHVAYDEIEAIESALGINPQGDAADLSARLSRVLSGVGNLQFPAATTLTIAAGAIAVTKNYHLVDTEGSTASDDLTTITGGADGMLLIIRPANGARTVVVKHNVGNILCVGNQDCTLDDSHDFVIMIYDLALVSWIVLQGGGGMAAHATTHQSGGADPIKLDDLATPDDTTDLNASTLRHGLLPKLSGDSSQYLNGLGGWATPAGGSGGSSVAGNLLINGGFDFAQRQVPGTLTVIANDKYSADRWRISRQSTDLQYQRNDALGETGLVSQFFGRFKQITNAGKFAIYQIVEGVNSVPFRGQTVIFQAMLRASAAKTIRMAILELQTAGTIDTIPATFVSAWGANSTDPTLGANLAVITGAQSKSVTTSWQQFSVSVTVPATSKNLICAVWTDSQFSANDTLDLAEAGLYPGSTAQPWQPRPMGQEMALALRYFEKSYELHMPPGSLTTDGLYLDLYKVVIADGNAYTSKPLAFLATKRAVPTVTFYSHVTGAAGFVHNMKYDGTNSVDRGAVGNLTTTKQTYIYTGTTAWSAAFAHVAAQIWAHWTAEAEL